MKVAEGACYFETVAANGVAMRAACNESHVIARRGHPPAEITSDGARCHDRDPHLALSASKTSICPKTARWKCLGAESDHLHDGHTCRFTSNSDRTDAQQRIVAQCHTGHCRSPYRPSKVRRAARASDIISVHANAIRSAAFQLYWPQVDNRLRFATSR